MKPIRVLQIVGSMHRGGIETMLMNFYRHLDKEKIQFDFLVHGNEKGYYEDEIVQMGGKIYHVRKKTDDFLGNLKDMHNVIFENKYKIVHVHQDAMSMFALKEAKRAGASIRIAHAHSTSMPPSRLGRLIYPYAIRRMIRYSTVKLACSQASARYLFNGNISDTIYVRNGIDTRKFAFSKENRQKIREKYHIKDEFVVGQIANFQYPKNHGFSLDVFSEIIKKNSNSVLLLCGGGPLLPLYEHRVAELNLQKNVLFLGNVDNVNEILSGLDALILPSFYEGFPVALVEAQCAGLPCYVSDVVTKETEITNAIQYLSIKQAPKTWADEIMNVDPSMRKDGSEAVKKAGFDIADVSINLENLYLSLAKDLI